MPKLIKNQSANTQNKGQFQEGSCSLARKYPKCPEIIRPNLSAQTKKIGIFENKLSLGVRCLWEGAKMKMFIGYLLSKNLIMSQNIYFVCVMHALS